VSVGGLPWEDVFTEIMKQLKLPTVANGQVLQVKKTLLGMSKLGSWADTLAEKWPVISQITPRRFTTETSENNIFQPSTAKG